MIMGHIYNSKNRKKLIFLSRTLTPRHHKQSIIGNVLFSIWNIIVNLYFSCSFSDLSFHNCMISTGSQQTLSTLARVFADVSTYGTLHWLARLCATSTGTWRLSSRSILLPTSRNGIRSSLFTRRICSLQQHTHINNNLIDFLFNHCFTALHSRLIIS